MARTAPARVVALPRMSVRIQLPRAGASELERLFASIAKVTSDLRSDRESARSLAITAIRALETRTVNALDGDPIRVLPYLVSERAGKERYRGARFRGKLDEPLDDKDYQQARDGTGEWFGKCAAIICLDGRLRQACRVIDEDDRFLRVAERDVTDDELYADDLSTYADRLALILEGHVDRARSAGAKYVEAARLAKTIVEAIRA